LAARGVRLEIVVADGAPETVSDARCPEDLLIESGHMGNQISFGVTGGWQAHRRKVEN